MKNLLLRAEDKNIWERRSPITPADLKHILSQAKINAFIEKSDKRFFKESEYIASGAEVCEGMEKGDVVFGVKEIPVEKLLGNKVYIFFSHTIKGQKENMTMLKKIMDGHSTLIDYEKITNDQGLRQVFFGNYAGDAGAINILWLMGEYWQHQGLKTPFVECKQALQYHSVNEAREHFKQVGYSIKKDGIPQELGPIVIGLLGYGNVSTGAQSIINCLPVEQLEPENLDEFIQNKQGNLNTIYSVVFKEEHLVAHKEGNAFNLQEYYNQPEKYESQFTKYLPYLSILINATYWDKRYPRFVTWNALQNLYETFDCPKLQGIADITCDVNGSIECNVKTTDSGMPAYLCHPESKTITDGHKGDGIVLLAVDNLPAEVPNDASVFFSNQLKKYVPNILQADYNSTLLSSGLHPDVQKAVIVCNGKLTKDYEYLNQYL